jgi:3-deoxy-D-manno-octulosonate 8-phosphate phosphatase (KDO 8-P phosphatase)
VAITLLERLKRVRVAAFDVDGVLTDASLSFDDEGRESKTFNARDGLGFELLRRHGIRLAIITGRTSSIVTRRMAALKVDVVLQGAHDKSAALDQVLAQLNVTAEEVSYLGDDLIDAPALRRVGLAATVADGHAELDAMVHVRLNTRGGAGAGRELIELILRAQLGREDLVNVFYPA